jgi:mono/diheme cytochrome c family protein
MIASQEACTACHREGGSASEWSRLRFARDDAWVAAHVFVPTQLVPALADADAVALQRSRAVTIWRRVLRRGVPAPAPDERDARARALLGANCLGCHVLEDEGQGDAPNLTRVGRDRDVAWLTGWIADPLAYEFDSDMPGFAGRLTPEEIRLLAEYLSRRQ